MVAIQKFKICYWKRRWKLKTRNKHFRSLSRYSARFGSFLQHPFRRRILIFWIANTFRQFILELYHKILTIAFSSTWILIVFILRAFLQIFSISFVYRNIIECVQIHNINENLFFAIPDPDSVISWLIIFLKELYYL